MSTQRTPIIVVLACSALAAAGCGGTTRSGSGTAGATGTIEAHVSTTAHGGATFDVRMGRLRQQLTSGLGQVENGSAVSRLAGAGTVLRACSDTVTSRLGSRAKTSHQQEQVSQLRTACSDAANAVAKLKSGDTASASNLARTALQEIAQAK